MKIAVVGVTGLVGSKILQVLDELNFPVTELIPVASEKSVGKEIIFKGKSWKVVSLQSGVDAQCDIALFSAGGAISLEWAPEFAKKGTRVIDNSSAWRMDPTKKLIVPEINADSLTKEDVIIANPNCSTIQMVVALNELHKKLKIKRIIVSTYQSVTGTGIKAVTQLTNERNNVSGENAYPHKIDLNLIPQIDVFMENRYTKEEMKMILETQKIMRDNTIKVTATAVRIPVMGGHSESVNVEFERAFELNQIFDILHKTAGVIVVDEPSELKYPMPLMAHDKNEVFVGRVRIDESQPNTINMFIVADNLRKGAATNAVQIAQYLVDSKLV